MSFRFALLAVAALTACTTGNTMPDGSVEGPVVLPPAFEPPEGYPYPLGDLTGTIGGTAYTLKSYDYSVSAIDPNVWVVQSDDAWRMRGTFENATDPKAGTPEVTFTANPPASDPVAQIAEMWIGRGGNHFDLARKAYRTQCIKHRKCVPSGINAAHEYSD